MAETFWTDERFEEAKSLRERGATYEEIGRAVGCSAPSVWQKLRKVAPPCARAMTRRALSRAHIEVEQHIRPSDNALCDRDARMQAASDQRDEMLRRGDLSFLIGDLPPPGRSALDRKRAGV